MTFDEFASETIGPATRRDYDALIRFCEALEVDWKNESYRECHSKVQASMHSINEEMDQAEDPIEALDILHRRLGKIVRA